MAKEKRFTPLIFSLALPLGVVLGMMIKSIPQGLALVLLLSGVVVGLGTLPFDKQADDDDASMPK